MPKDTSIDGDNMVYWCRHNNTDGKVTLNDHVRPQDDKDKHQQNQKMQYIHGHGTDDGNLESQS